MESQQSFQDSQDQTHPPPPDQAHSQDQEQTQTQTHTRTQHDHSSADSSDPTVSRTSSSVDQLNFACPHCNQNPRTLPTNTPNSSSTSPQVVRRQQSKRTIRDSNNEQLAFTCFSCEECYTQATSTARLSVSSVTFVVWEGVAYCAKCHSNIVFDDLGVPVGTEGNKKPVSGGEGSWLVDRMRSITRRKQKAHDLNHTANSIDGSSTVAEQPPSLTRGGESSADLLSQLPTSSNDAFGDPNHNENMAFASRATAETPALQPTYTSSDSVMRLIPNILTKESNPAIHRLPRVPPPQADNDHDGEDDNTNPQSPVVLASRFPTTSTPSNSPHAKHKHPEDLKGKFSFASHAEQAKLSQQKHGTNNSSLDDEKSFSKMNSNDSAASSVDNAAQNHKQLQEYSLSNAFRSPQPIKTPLSPSGLNHPVPTKRPSLPTMFRARGAAGKSVSETNIQKRPADRGLLSPKLSLNTNSEVPTRRPSAGQLVSRSISRGIGKIRRGSSANAVVNKKESKITLKKQAKSFFNEDNPNHFDIQDLQKNLGIKVTKDTKNHGRNIRKAACYMVDAFSGRLKNGLGSTFDKPWYVRFAFRVHMSPGYKEVLKVLAVLLNLLVFWEPPSFKRAHDVSEGTTLTTHLVELLLILLLLSDYMLRFLYMGWENIKTKQFILMLMYVELFCLVDIIIAVGIGRETVRISRVLRPAVFILTDKNSLQLSRQCMGAERKLRTLALMLVFTVCLFAILIGALCSVNQWRMDLTQYNRLGTDWGQSWIPFRTFPYAVTPLLAMLSGEGFPDVAVPWIQERGELMIIFYALIVVGSLTLLNLAMAVQVDEFQRLQTKTTKTEEKKLMKTLAVVFYLARDERTLRISKEHFQLLMKAYRPRLKISVIDMLFMSVDNNNTHDLDLTEFLDLCEHLRSAEMSKKQHYDKTVWESIVNAVGSGVNNVLQAIDERIHILSPQQQLAFFQLINNPNLAHVTNVVILANTISLAILPDARNQPPYVFWILVADFVCFGLFVLEMVLQLYVNGRQRFWKVGWNRFQVFATLIGGALFALYPLTHWYIKHRLRMSDPDLSLHKLACCVRTLRLFKGQRRFSMYIHLTKKTRPVLQDFAKVILCFMYFHGIVCMEVLWNTTPYATPTNMALSQLALLTVDGWQNTVYGMWEEVDNTAEKICVVVLICCFIWYISIITLSQLMAVMYDIFKVYKNKLELKDLPVAANKPGKGKNSIAHLELKSKQSLNWRRQMLGREEGDKIKSELVDTVGYYRSGPSNAGLVPIAESSTGSNDFEVVDATAGKAAKTVMETVVE